MDFPPQYCSNKNINGNDELDIRINIIENERKNVHQNKQQLNNGGSVILVLPGIIGQDLAKKTQLLQLSLTTFLTD